jgi:hypothetical protein
MGICLLRWVPQLGTRILEIQLKVQVNDETCKRNW